MHYELNIGLDPANGCDTQVSRAVRADKALNMLRDANIAVSMSSIIGDLRGTAEPCLYVAVIGRNIGVAVGHISEKLGQDCIAMVDENGQGALVGPRASAWGDFNPEFFRRPELVEAE